MEYFQNNRTEDSYPAWMDDESVKNIDKRKLEFLGNVYANTKGKSQKELMAYMMPMMQKAKKENLTFTPQEMQLAVNAIKKYSSKEELEQIDKIMKQAHNKPRT